MTNDESKARTQASKKSRPLWRAPAVQLLAFIAVILAAQCAAFGWYKWKGERFCDALDVGLPQADLLERAERAGMERLPDTWASPAGNEMIFMTNRAPWYRHYCRVRVVDERVSGAVLAPGD
ncbi:hypothetical protein [Niveibacterium sp. COAC-50]|uniref:hypothetical protein n=1 Tax=Niveibacterium sp. COAC-50 TaxID=2729384 RepID=UPI00155407F3|nr:hypothetical protein [Niveibacterium sp. COAC-50]